MNAELNAELKKLIEQADATIARLCEILDRVEGRVNSIPSQPAGFPPGLPPLPAPPPGMRWEYIGRGTGATGKNIYTFQESTQWLESETLSVVQGIHYAV